MTTTLAAPDSRVRRRPDLLPGLAVILAVIAGTSSVIGLLAGDGAGRQLVQTTRGATVTLYGDGLYAADTWLVGAGNRGQDLAMLIFELPVLLLALRWYRRGSAPAAAVLTGVLAFFSYYFLSMVFGTAQNRLFPLYVFAAALASFGLAAIGSRLKLTQPTVELPPRPRRAALVAYLIAVALALVLAWLPEMIMTAVSGDIARTVGPYTSAATQALDLGLVVPVVVLTIVNLLRQRPSGSVLVITVLALNVCIGLVLMAQGIAQLVSGVPLTVGEIIAKMLSFAVLTLVAGGLLARMALSRRATRR
jgi:hypothetical protein